MLDFSQTKLTYAIAHWVGNKSRDEGFLVGDKPLDVQTEIINSFLMQYFLRNFDPQANQTYSLNVEGELYSMIRYMFENQYFRQPSENIAALLYEKQEHPKINAGDFYVAYFEDCILGDEVVKAMGVFKSENKENFLKINQNEFGCPSGITVDRGNNLNSLEKGCLIFNTEAHKGYVAVMFDNSDFKSFWKDDFLKLTLRKETPYFQTSDFLSYFNDFAKQVTEEKHEIVELQQNALGLFQNEVNEPFDLEKFEQEVLVDANKIKLFSDYRQKKEEEGAPLHTDFNISSEAIRKAKRAFKTQFKLDNNFTVQVHSPHGIIERGFDEITGQKYYKLYFDEEK